jgi:hypothetical protein
MCPVYVASRFISDTTKRSAVEFGNTTPELYLQLKYNVIDFRLNRSQEKECYLFQCLLFGIVMYIQLNSCTFSFLSFLSFWDHLQVIFGRGFPSLQGREGSKLLISYNG